MNKTRVKRKNTGTLRGYMDDEIKSMEDYQAMFDNVAEAEGVASAIEYMTKRTMSKKVLTHFIRENIDHEAISGLTLVQRQNISKLVGTPEFDRVIEMLVKKDDFHCISGILLNQKWRANQLQEIMVNYELLDKIVKVFTYSRLMTDVIINNKIPYEEIMEYIENTEANRPSYFVRTSPYERSSRNYQLLGSALLRAYEVPKEHILNRFEIFNSGVIGIDFDFDNFTRKGFTFSEILSFHGGYCASIGVDMFTHWLKNNVDEPKGIDLTRAKMYAVGIKHMSIPSENALMNLVTELSKDKNSFLEISDSIIMGLLERSNLRSVVWSKVMLSVPDKVSKQVFEVLNNNPYESGVIVGRTSPSIDAVLEKVETRQNDPHRFRECEGVIVSYDTLKKWESEDAHKFNEICKYISLKRIGTVFFSNVDYDREFLDFMLRHFEEDVKEMGCEQWASIFNNNKMEDSLAFEMAMDAFRKVRDRNNQRNRLPQSAVREVFANMHGDIPLEVIKEFSEYLNFAYDIRALDNGVKTIFTKGEF